MQALQDCLVTLREVITAHQGEGSGASVREPTPSEYFAVITATLSSGRIGDKLPLLLKVFSAVIPSTNVTILRSQFKPVSQLLTNVIQSTGDDTNLLATALACMSKLLQAQETSDGFWSQVQSLQSLNTLLAFVDDNTPKVRKAAHDGIIALLTTHSKAQTVALRTYLSDFIIGVMKAATRSSYRRAHCMVILLESTLIYIPGSHLRKVMEACIKLQNCEIPRLTASVYRMMDSLYQHPQFNQYFNKDQSVPAILMLLTVTINTNDVETLCHYYHSIASAMVVLEKSKALSTNLKLFKKALQTLVKGCESEYTQVHCAIGASLKRICQVLFTDANLKKSLEWYQTHHSTVSFSSIPTISSDSILFEVQMLYETVTTMESMLQLRYQSSWMYVLDSVRTIFDSFRGRPHLTYFLSTLISKLIEIQNAIENNIMEIQADVKESLQDCFGSVLQSCGLKTFLEVVPIIETNESSSDGKEGSGSMTIKVKEWVLALLGHELKNMTCKLADFMNAILPLAGKLHKMAVNLAQVQQATGKKSLDVQIKLLRNHVVQLWSLFPEICFGTVLDISSSFPKMKTVLTSSFEDNDYPEIAFAIVMGLHRLVKSSQHSPVDKQILASQSPVYLPLFLKFVEGMDLGDGRFRETLQCISAWASIAPENLITTISKKLLQLVLMTTNLIQDIEQMQSQGMMNIATQLQDAATWMAVILSILPYMSKSLVVILYRTVRPLLSLEESTTIQKRAYNLLHALIQSHPKILFEEESRLNILSLLCDSLLTAHVSSRNMRLKCIHALLQQTNDVNEVRQAFELIVGEVLICQKDANKKTRDQSLDILAIFSQKLPSVEVFHKLCAALVAETTLMRSSAVNALTLHLLGQFKKHRHDQSMEEDDSDNEDDAASMQDHNNNDSDAEEDGGNDDDMNEGNDSDHEEDGVMNTEEDYENLIRAAMQLLPSITLLMSQQCTDQTKSALAYLKILSTIASRDQLQEYVEVMVQSCCGELGALKSKFSSRTRAILRKLLRKFTEDELRPLLPTADIPLLDYIARQNRKQLRKKQMNQQKKGSKLDRMLSEDSEDEDSEEDEDQPSNHDKKSRRDQRSVYDANEMDVEEDYRLQSGRRVKGILAKGNSSKDNKMVHASAMEDLLEGRIPSSIMASIKRPKITSTTDGAVSSSSLRAGNLEEFSKNMEVDEDQFNVVVTSEGRVVVKEREVDTMSLHSMGKRDAEKNKAPSVTSQSKYTSNNKNNQANKKRKFNLKEPGAEYRAKKAGGDVWKKGMKLQPHAYIPLDPRLLSKKHHNTAVEHFGVVVDSAKNNRRKVQVKRK